MNEVIDITVGKTGLMKAGEQVLPIVSGKITAVWVINSKGEIVETETQDDGTFALLTAVKSNQKYKLLISYNNEPVMRTAPFKVKPGVGQVTLSEIPFAKGTLKVNGNENVEHDLDGQKITFTPSESQSEYDEIEYTYPI